MSKKKEVSKLSIEEREKELWEMEDEDIDYSDIPPLDEEFLKNAKRVEHLLLEAENIVYIEPSILNWFKNKAEDKEYQTLINDVLLTYIKTQQI
ncbi:MAG: BrnA antitoxin family protein [Gomphosphaeria aponina SAG 52.96 = DSM 107014]|uniref:BrnA antitoxin family protein n=1 Tax=Gomphosphaeria aponina SAG 52.96 = DSM 107014 TaxID=1521640 RepID=A0A941GSB9_9CHRO|nr:BrnA antitoxin family protein [Gomphosphaeria aponina SAG 52.96 = DSM 107014]